MKVLSSAQANKPFEDKQALTILLAGIIKENVELGVAITLKVSQREVMVVQLDIEDPLVESLEKIKKEVIDRKKFGALVKTNENHIYMVDRTTDVHQFVKQSREAIKKRKPGDSIVKIVDSSVDSNKIDLDKRSLN
jgi:hypothetical protein